MSVATSTSGIEALNLAVNDRVSRCACRGGYMRLCARVGVCGCTAGESEVVGLGAHSTMFGLALVGVASALPLSFSVPLPTLFPSFQNVQGCTTHSNIACVH
jgi:hypothetical protein